MALVYKMIKVFLSHFAQLGDQWGNWRYACTTGLAPVIGHILLVVVYAPVKAGRCYSQNQPISLFELPAGILPIDSGKRFDASLVQLFEQDLYALVLNR